MGRPSLYDAIRLWIATVASVETGYEGDVEEYAYDLHTRDYLEELRTRLPGFWAEYIDRCLQPWDERFRAATVEEAEPYLPALTDEPGWWQFRTPWTWNPNLID